VDDAHDGPYAREPQVEDLARIGQALNEAGARYVLIGGFAVIARGGARTTKDIDLLIDPSPENVARVKQALRILEDRAVDEVADDDVVRYSVVRVADEVVVDLMAKACGVDYETAAQDMESLVIGGVSIPVASVATLIRTKDTIRPSDAADRLYLEDLLRVTRADGSG
jgi:predicted nucleotidyltransferase